jgi:ribonuclease P protein component
VTVQRYGSEDPTLLAFAVGVGAGGAVARNRIRRRLAAAARDVRWTGPMVVSARREAATLPFDELRAHLATAAEAAGRKAAR